MDLEAFQNIKNQTPEICLAAIKHNNAATGLVRNKTILDNIIDAKFAGEILNNNDVCSEIPDDILGFLRQKVIAAAAMSSSPITDSISRVTRRQAPGRSVLEKEKGD